jgi:cellulose synthase/poly-beta-1,6-N-acetylglucosamine synthase-like glycosyltransferase
MTISIICIIVVFVFFIIQVLLLFFIAARKQATPVTIHSSEWPAISILVAARNEETNIEACLQALSELDYPENKVQILVGNDQSEDLTREKIAAFAKTSTTIQLVDISTTMGKAKGKANVLAQLARRANGQYFLITDADIVVNTQWAKELVSYFDAPKTGIVSAVTFVHGPSLFARMQGLDWLYFMGLLTAAYNAGIHCTAVGNNMAISKEAYDSVGGYESLDFSVTEDFKLYKEVRKKGWGALNILNTNSLNISKPALTLLQLLHQRKRWLMGARELPFYWWVAFGFLALVFPALLVLAFYQPIMALQLYLIKVGIQTLFIFFLQRQLSLRHHLPLILLYDLYAAFIAVVTPLFYVLPITMQWKKRKYN